MFQKSFLWLIIILFTFCFLTSCQKIQPQPQLQKGILDLRHWDFDKNSSLQIRGNSFFHWKKFLSPNQFDSSKKLVKIPANWNSYQWNGKKIGSKGFGTYSFKIILPKKNKRAKLGFVFNTVSSAYKIFVEDSLVNEVGKIGKKSQNTTSLFKHNIYEIPNLNKDTIQVTLQVANFITKNGGIWRSPVIGKYDTLVENKNLLVNTDFFLLGSLIIIGLYHLGLFLYRPKEYSALYFAIVCLIIATRTIALSYFNLVDYWSGYTWELREKASYLTFSLSLLFMISFFKVLFIEKYANKITKLAQLICILFSVIVLVTPHSINVYLLVYFQLFTLFIILGGLFLLIRAIYKKTEGSSLFAVGFLILSIGVINDILYSRMIINTGYFVSFALFIFILLQAIMLAIRFAKSFYQTEKLSLELNEVNKNLENIVTERTQSLEKIKNDLELKNQHLTDSINYAKYIQDAFLPSPVKIKNIFPESFILFNPLATVSGDFYWTEEINGKIIITVADCTGHGVPGAFMSLIAESFLRQITVLQKVLEPDKILKLLHQSIYDSLNQAENDNTDGMDIALCVIDKDKKQVKFSGARNGLLYIKNGELSYIKGDKASIGGLQRENDFTKHVIDFEEDFYFYLFSDGYKDQFGGQNNKKFMLKSLIKLIHKHHKETLTKQKDILTNTMTTWKEEGKEEQVDDITVFGAKIA